MRGQKRKHPNNQPKHKLLAGVIKTTQFWPCSFHLQFWRALSTLQIQNQSMGVYMRELKGAWQESLKLVYGIPSPKVQPRVTSANYRPSSKNWQPPPPDQNHARQYILHCQLCTDALLSTLQKPVLPPAACRDQSQSASFAAKCWKLTCIKDVPQFAVW